MKRQAAGASVQVVACGKKAVGYFTYRKVEPVLGFTDLSADPTVEEAASVAAYAIDGYENGTIDEVFVVYNHSKNAAEQVLRTELVLPRGHGCARCRASRRRRAGRKRARRSSRAM